MSLVFKKINAGDTVKTNNGLVFKILTIGADDTDFTPTPSLIYTLSNDGTYYIIGTGFTDIATLEADTSGGTAGSGLDSTWTGGELYIPNTYNDKPVLAIAPRAFADVTNITTCYIQEGITHIGHRAFQKSNVVTSYALESIELPKSLTYLGGSGGRVFWYNYSLKSINTKNLTILELNTFYGCTVLINIDAPNVKTIGNNAFRSCTALKKIYIPNVTTIGNNVFYDCCSLKVVIISQETSICPLTSISVFTNCYRLFGQYHATYNPNSEQDCYIYVPDSLVDDYKQATNWNSLYTQIKPLSELPQEYKDLYNIA